MSYLLELWKYDIMWRQPKTIALSKTTDGKHRTNRWTISNSDDKYLKDNVAGVGSCKFQLGISCLSRRIYYRCTLSASGTQWLKYLAFSSRRPHLRICTKWGVTVFGSETARLTTGLHGGRLYCRHSFTIGQPQVHAFWNSKAALATPLIWRNFDSFWHTGLYYCALGWAYASVTAKWEFYC